MSKILRKHQNNHKILCRSLVESCARAPVIVGVLHPVDTHALSAHHLAPVAGLLAGRCMAESRSFTLAWVVAAPVQQADTQQEHSIVCSLVLRVIFHVLAVLPEEQIVDDCVHDRTQVARFSLDSLELLACFADDPEVGRHQRSQVSVAELHGQVVAHVYCTQHDRDARATVLVPEQRNPISHAHQSLIARVSLHRVGAHLRGNGVGM
jgi:hypothetical protein